MQSIREADQLSCNLKVRVALWHTTRKDYAGRELVTDMPAITELVAV